MQIGETKAADNGIIIIKAMFKTEKVP